ncbi:MAG: hypothetical protein V4576_03975 [Patescibacteria group bacterium]
MAEEKKDAKKEVKKSSGPGFEDLFLLVLGIITIFFVTIPRFSSTPTTTVVDNNGYPVQQENLPSIPAVYDKVFNEHVEGNTRTPSLIDETRFRLTDLFKNLFYAAIIIAIFLTLLFWILKNYFVFKLKMVKAEYAKSVGVKLEVEKPIESMVVPADYVPDTNGLRNPKWEMIEAYAKSGNQAELRLAIIEADIMLADVLMQSGFPGNTLGEILKNTDKSKLATIEYAWRAHRVRNELAHQGSTYVLGRAEAEAALDGYRRVFTELNLI